MVDDELSKPAQWTRKKIHLIAQEGFGIGHQDATSYGVNWEQKSKEKTYNGDVFKMTNEYPLVYGFDIGNIEHGNPKNIDGVPFDLMRDMIKRAYKNGGIITISWHIDNPVTGGDSWDKTSAISNILNNKEVSGKYDLWLSRAAEFMGSLKFRGKPIPIIYRPFHEMNGSWFWWGGDNCYAEDYKTLWKRTVKDLKDKHGLHNLIYTYSPNKLGPEDDYMEYYPGDEYVDILGIDIYDFNNPDDYKTALSHDLNIVRSIAEEKGKPFAFTETGFETIPNPKWFTEVLYPELKDSGISWVLFWRNDRTEHHYLPYPGHISEADFKEFIAFPETLVLKDFDKLKY